MSKEMNKDTHAQKLPVVTKMANRGLKWYPETFQGHHLSLELQVSTQSCIGHISILPYAHTINTLGMERHPRARGVYFESFSHSECVTRPCISTS